MKKINIVTLGCAKNRVDSEHLAAQLALAGYKIIHDRDRNDASILVINTCGFIADAKQESIDFIFRAVKSKRKKLLKQIFVIGCLAERYADLLRAEIPEVDSFFGVRDMEGVLKALGATYHPEFATQRMLSTPPYSAYLKISEGCSRKCGYCAIPLIRGEHRSVPMETLVEEAQRLVRGGVRELIVVAQDTTSYGIDLYGYRALGELLTRLCRIKDLNWIRLHYAYPAAFPDDVIEVMAREEKICKYLDIPFQHISDSQLASMRRHHTKADAYALVRRLRERIPGLALRTTLLVGYPGETDADFEELLQFVRDCRFERLGVFTYSAEEGTYSAEHLANDVPPEVKQARANAVMELQNSIARENNMRRIGSVERVLVDSRDCEYYVARSQYDSPEVDQEVLIPASQGRMFKGHFYDVRITSADDYDLYAERLS